MRPLYSWIDRDSLGKVKEQGLLSSKAILDRPNVLEQIAKVRGITSQQFRDQIKKGLKGWKPESYLGPSLMFQPPHKDFDPLPNHPTKIRDLVPISIDIDTLLKDHPKTRLHGNELIPYKEEDSLKHGKTYASMRHRDLTPEEFEQYRSMSSKELWGRYDDIDRRGLYAPNVPHVAVITPSGHIAPKYLRFPKEKPVIKTASEILIKEQQDKKKCEEESPNYTKWLCNLIRRRNPSEEADRIIKEKNLEG